MGHFGRPSCLENVGKREGEGEKKNTIASFLEQLKLKGTLPILECGWDCADVNCR